MKAQTWSIWTYPKGKAIGIVNFTELIDLFLDVEIIPPLTPYKPDKTSILPLPSGFPASVTEGAT